MRVRKDLLSVYVDVKALYDTVNASEVPLIDVQDMQISPELYRSHMLRKSFLAAVLSELVTEIKKSSENMSLWDRWKGRQWDYNQLVEKLSLIAVDVKKARLTNEEVPILRRINETARTRHSAEQTSQNSSGGSVTLSPTSPSITLSAQMEDIDKTLSDNGYLAGECRVIECGYDCPHWY